MERIGVVQGNIVQKKDANGNLLTDSNGQPILTWEVSTDDVKITTEDLTVLFLTKIGELYRNEYFGTYLWELIEEPDISIKLFLMKNYIEDSLKAYEKRIASIDMIAYKRYSGKIDFEVNLSILSKDNTNNVNIPITFDIVNKQIYGS